MNLLVTGGAGFLSVALKVPFTDEVCQNLPNINL